MSSVWFANENDAGRERSASLRTSNRQHRKRIRRRLARTHRKRFSGSMSASSLRSASSVFALDASNMKPTTFVLFHFAAPYGNLNESVCSVERYEFVEFVRVVIFEKAQSPEQTSQKSRRHCIRYPARRPRPICDLQISRYQADLQTTLRAILQRASRASKIERLAYNPTHHVKRPSNQLKTL